MNTILKLRKKISVLVVLFLAVTVLSGCLKKADSKYDVTIEVWGVFDDSSDYNDIIQEYRKKHPFVKGITYRKFTIEEYEKTLLDALAAGNGPDVFMINNAWGLDYQNKIVPAPSNIIREQQLDANFVSVVKDDFYIDNQLYALPLSVDALGLYYNKTLFNAAGMTEPPATWQEFDDAVRKLTQIDQYGNIVQAGAAMGTAKNVNRSIDIVTMLMLQSGVTMSGAGGATFAMPTGNEVIGNGQTVPAGEAALDYYTRFAQPAMSTYTWNNRQHYSLDAFTAGTVGMMLNYSWHYNTIKHKNPKLRIGVAPAPQFDVTKPVNVANYWAFAVAKNKKSLTSKGAVVPDKIRIHEAWQFIKYMTMAKKGNFTIAHGVNGKQKNIVSEIDPAATYLAKTGKPAARTDLVTAQQADATLGPFAYGVINSHNWRRRSAQAVETIFADMIDQVILGKNTVSKAIKLAQSRVSQLMSGGL